MRTSINLLAYAPVALGVLLLACGSVADVDDGAPAKEAFAQQSNGLPPFPSGVAPWPEFAKGAEVWLTLGGPSCATAEELVSGNNSLGEAHQPGAAKLIAAGGPDVVRIASTIAQHRSVRVFADPTWCKTYADQLRQVPGVTVESTPMDRIWLRDFAPHWLMRGEQGPVLLDAPYFAGQLWAAIADAFPSFLADRLAVEKVVVDRPEYSLQGGDFEADEDANCFYNDPIFNPWDDAATVEAKRAAFPPLMTRMGCQRQFALEPLPHDGTGHIDMAVMITKGKKALVAHFADPRDHEAQATMDRNYAILESAGYGLLRVEMGHPAPEPKELGSGIEGLLGYQSYLNALLDGDLAFVPQYGSELDAQALAAYREAGYAPVPIRVENLAVLAGAVHCVAIKSPLGWRTR